MHSSDEIVPGLTNYHKNQSWQSACPLIKLSRNNQQPENFPSTLAFAFDFSFSCDKLDFSFALYAQLRDIHLCSSHDARNFQGTLLQI